jgi:hypothetical protein
LKHDTLLDNKRTSRFQLNALLALSEYRVLAFLATTLCFVALVDASIQQFQMFLFGGQILVGNSLTKTALLVAVAVGCVLHPKVKISTVPWLAWALCIGYLIVEVIHLTINCGMSLGDALFSYYNYYCLFLIGPALLIFRGAVSQRTLVRCSVFIFVVCAMLAAAQHLTASPILYTESLDGSFAVPSWMFADRLRAFSLFGSALEFGLFCAFFGALGIALARKMPVKGALLVIASALACYTTLTRLCYLSFVGATASSLVFTFGKRPSRGSWLPFLWFLVGLSTIFVGLSSTGNVDAGSLQEAGSLLGRLNQWVYFSDLFVHSSLVYQLFGLGLVQSDSLQASYGMVIDNTLLALLLHVGVVGLVLFGTLITRMWIYLRREAVATEQPFVIAAASFWATIACAGTFNIIFGSFGVLFALAILCNNGKEYRTRSELAGAI